MTTLPGIASLLHGRRPGRLAVAAALVAPGSKEKYGQTTHRSWLRKPGRGE